MTSRLDGDDNVNQDEDCSTTGVIAVDAGTHTISFEVAAVEATTDLFHASVWVMWVPFDGTGSTPTAFTQLGDLEDIDELIEEPPDN